MTPEQRKKRLYLVFDDWNSGYSIRKVSLSRRSGKRSEQSSSDSGEEDSEHSNLGKGTNPKPKPKPLRVFMRVRATPRGFPNFFTSAFGTKIMAMHPGATGDIFGGIPAVDVQDRTISFELPSNRSSFPLCIPVGDDKLFVLGCFGSFEVLQKQEPSGLWAWRRVTNPPLTIGLVSYGVRPDGCILVSTKSDGTFVLDTKEHVWDHYGDWVFPFTDLGHYDPSLKGFVGLSKDLETLGHLYFCSMASTDTASGDTAGRGLHPSPDFKCTKKTVYNEDPDEGQHISATLVHMGQSKFCLEECICTGSMPTDQDYRVPLGADQLYFVGGGPQGGRFMYRLKTFSLGYDTKGDLKLRHCKVRRYSLPHEARIGSVCLDPVAFCL